MYPRVEGQVAYPGAHLQPVFAAPFPQAPNQYVNLLAQAMYAEQHSQRAAPQQPAPGALSRRARSPPRPAASVGPANAEGQPVVKTVKFAVPDDPEERRVWLRKQADQDNKPVVPTKPKSSPLKALTKVAAAELKTLNRARAAQDNDLRPGPDIDDSFKLRRIDIKRESNNEVKMEVDNDRLPMGPVPRPQPANTDPGSVYGQLRVSRAQRDQSPDSPRSATMRLRREQSPHAPQHPRAPKRRHVQAARRAEPGDGEDEQEKKEVSVGIVGHASRHAQLVSMSLHADALCYCLM